MILNRYNFLSNDFYGFQEFKKYHPANDNIQIFQVDYHSALNRYCLVLFLLITFLIRFAFNSTHP